MGDIGDSDTLQSEREQWSTDRHPRGLWCRNEPLTGNRRSGEGYVGGRYAGGRFGKADGWPTTRRVAKPAGRDLWNARSVGVGVPKVRGRSEPPRPFQCHEEESVYSGKGGAPCDTTTLTNGHFFRDDEQTAAWIPVRDTGKAGHTGRPRRQGAGREARAQ
jgi:hypothetical protein